MSSFLNSIVRGFGSQIGRTAASETIHYASENRSSFGTTLLYLIVYPLLTVSLLIGGLCYWASNSDTSQTKSAVEVKTDSSTIANSNVEYYKGHVVYTGPRGGRYYLTKSGRKHYL